ncbi:dihydrolipoyllysine-residue succinyltransferase component of 2-oxoglutarate dehydrogenase complex [Adhaeribacter aerolatus]|uniref:Dihydrolipoyllysine-residue succinyltransferase component of 2-oxoglutarate dehydrogenase complex n=1 Tax=Adhaeribacter aerolatus TaxID=670289 RepID=A0A512ASZ3_9BACT|nr:2-oxoglutarate dehydrogenase complex dihydrolipoyllysine-residue succinyltransferase [Adhaeribacter aerolatus]GEO02826.1 dihydrolipoyllysine-residue succinyltransferase component of 2-oxoglutarate dehydrogenase complex [Adhaeribacter aerolatus]
MGLEIKVPVLGESITEVTIAKWLKKDGEQVAMDEVICELESDKATFELPAEAAGILKIIAQEGETIPVGAVLAEISGNGVATAPAPASGAAAPAENQQSGYGGSGQPTSSAPAPEVVSGASAKAPSAEGGTSGTGEVKEIKIPAVGESISEVTISKWLKKDGDQVAMDEVLCELESDKATFELPAEAAGTLKIIAQEGETIPVGAVICNIQVGGNGAAGASAPTSAPAAQPQAQAAAAPTGGTSAYAAGTPSPAAGKILSEKGINAGDVAGTGRDGRITKEDALKAQSKPAAPAPAPAATPAAPAAQPANTGGQAGSRNQRRERMSSLRKTVARRLVAVKNETAMLTTFNEVDMKPIMDIRAKYKDKFKEKHSVGLGFMSFFVKACTVALQEFPSVNAMIDEGEMVFNDFCDISIAVSAPKGLVVPVIRNAESLPLDGIEKEVIRLATRARDNKISIEEMTGGTFTITNGGVFGSMMSTPIINAPQSAILGMHNIIQRPVAIDGQVVIRPMMYVALSYDHRIIDGRESVSFLVRVKELLEDPMRLLLGV